MEQVKSQTSIHRPVPPSTLTTATTTNAITDTANTTLLKHREPLQEWKIGTAKGAPVAPPINDLSNLSTTASIKTSKYWRSVAESFLYRDLTFRTTQHADLLRLFLTVVSRPNLVAHVKRVQITRERTQHTGGYSASEEFLYSRLWNKLQNVQHRNAFSLSG